MFQLVFEYTFYESPKDETLALMLCNSDLTDDDKDYITKTYNGVVANFDALKAQIAPYLKNFTVDRLARPDLVALVLGVYELTQKEAPVAVVISEAVALSKKYGTEDSGAFVNGVLGNFARSMNA